MKKRNLLIFLLLPLFCLAQTSLKIKNEKETTFPLKSLIDSTANKMVEKPLINAVSIGMVYQGQEFIGHYGELEKGKSNVPTNQTIYEIGSLSKTFTGTLVAKAVLDKKINLDDPVQKYLTEDYPNLSFNGSPVRVKDLLTHTSGLPNMIPLELTAIIKDFTNIDTPKKMNDILVNYTQKDFLRDLHTIKIDTIPGFNFSYSSAGIEILALILEKTYNKKFEVLLKEYYSENAEMKPVQLVLSKKEEKNLAVGYHCDYPSITLPNQKLPWGAAANVKITVPEMIKYIKYQLKDNADVAESHRGLVKVNEKFSAGYCWRVLKDEKMGEIYMHHGGVPRSQCFIYILPKYNMGVFIVTNQSGENTPKDMKEVLNTIFEKIQNKNLL